jgi:hypothetical protein
MADSPRQALLDARKLVRTFASAPDPRRRAQEVLSVLRRAEGWPPDAMTEIAATDGWLRDHPSVLALAERLRGMLAKLEGSTAARR